MDVMLSYYFTEEQSRCVIDSWASVPRDTSIENCLQEYYAYNTFDFIFF